jgi:hypothetical protein
MSDPHQEIGTGLAGIPATTKGGSVSGKPWACNIVSSKQLFDWAVPALCSLLQAPSFDFFVSF